jgi:spore germination protein YaaH
MRTLSATLALLAFVAGVSPLHAQRAGERLFYAVDWMDEVVRYVLLHVPPEKVSLGIPTGAQHWYTSQEERITPEMARSYSVVERHRLRGISVWVLGPEDPEIWPTLGGTR